MGFDWTPECTAAFTTLKTKLCEAPILVYPSFDKDFTLETDASIDGIGAVLSQPQADGCLHPVAFASRSLSPAERNYAITDLETLAVVWVVTHFRCYLYGHSVTVYTDHSAVRAVLETPNPTGRHARWWMRVHGCGIKSVTIVYHPGKTNANADALSRNPVGVPPTEGIAETDMQVAMVQSQQSGMLPTIREMLVNAPHSTTAQPFLQEQLRDPDIAKMIEYLEENRLPADSDQARTIVIKSALFTVIDNVLFITHRDGTKRVVVPTHLRRQLMDEHHRGPCGSHFAADKLYGAVSCHWWWQGMRRDILHFIRNFPECTVVSGGQRTVYPPLHPIEICRPFQIIGVDIMDLPLTKRGNRHVLVFQDYFTKWPMVYAIPDQKSHRIVQILCEDIIPMFGVPEALLSYRGTNLLSHLMLDVCKTLGIRKLNTTAYHPQCNGMVERLNRTLKTMLRKHAARFGCNRVPESHTQDNATKACSKVRLQWDTYLPGVLWAYRNSPHDVTGEKPSFLLFGMDLRTPSQAALLPPSPSQRTTVEEYKHGLLVSLSAA